MTIKTLPMPAARAFGGNRGTSKYEFGDLEAGTEQCLLYPSEDTKKTISKLHSAIGAYRARGGAGKFAVRVVEVEGVVNVGVWRTA